GQPRSRRARTPRRRELAAPAGAVVVARAVARRARRPAHACDVVRAREATRRLRGVRRGVRGDHEAVRSQRERQGHRALGAGRARAPCARAARRARANRRTELGRRSADGARSSSWASTATPTWTWTGAMLRADAPVQESVL